MLHPNTRSQTALLTTARSMAEHVEHSMMEAHGFNDPMYRDPAYIAYCEEQQRRHDEGRDYPIGDLLPCYECKPITGVQQVCTGLGPVTNRADPTQTYRLACGHLAI